MPQLRYLLSPACLTNIVRNSRTPKTSSFSALCWLIVNPWCFNRRRISWVRLQDHVCENCVSVYNHRTSSFSLSYLISLCYSQLCLSGFVRLAFLKNQSKTSLPVLYRLQTLIALTGPIFVKMWRYVQLAQICWVFTQMPQCYIKSLKTVTTQDNSQNKQPNSTLPMLPSSNVVQRRALSVPFLICYSSWIGKSDDQFSHVGAYPRPKMSLFR